MLCKTSSGWCGTHCQPFLIPIRPFVLCKQDAESRMAMYRTLLELEPCHTVLTNELQVEV